MRYRSIVAFTALLIALVGTMQPATAQDTATDEDELAGYLAQADASAPDYGPVSGTLVPDGTADSRVDTDVNLDDVAISVSGIAPTVDPGESWVLQVLFREDSTGSAHSIVLVSDGSLAFAPHGLSEFTDGKTFPFAGDAGNPYSLDIVAVGDTAYVALDGVFISTFDLSGYTDAGTVGLRTLIFEGDYDAGNTPLEITDFTVTGLAGSVSNGLGESPQTGTPDETYTALIAQAESIGPVFGPATGSLVADDSANAIVFAEVDISDGVIHAEGIAPSVDIGEDWGLIVIFRNIDEMDPHSVALWSDNAWTFIPADDGELVGGDATFDSAAGTPFSIDVVMSGDTGYLGVNGQFVDTLDLSAYTGPGTVIVGATLSGGEYDLGNSPIELTSLTVTNLSGAAPQTGDTSGNTQQGDPTSDAERFDSYLAAAQTVPADVGPVSGTIDHTDGSISTSDPGLSVSNFVAHLECIPPGPGTGGAWDCGFRFRLPDTGDHYRFGVVSTGTWFHTIGASDIVQAGEGLILDQTPGATVTLDLIADGSVGYVGVNGEYVGTLDLSAIAGPGDVGILVNHFGESNMPGGVTEIGSFEVWSLDAGSALSGALTDTIAEDPDLSEDETTGISGNTWTSPNFGFVYEWEDPWFNTAELNQGGADLVGFSNGPILMWLELYPGLETPAECVEGMGMQISNRESTLDISILIPLEEGDGDATATYIYTRQNSDGTTSENVNQVTCWDFEDQDGMIRLELIVDQEDAVEQAGEIALTKLSVGLAVITHEFGVATTGDSETTTESGTTADPAEADYTSPTYGYSLNWGPDWEIGDVSSNDGADYLSLSLDGVLFADLLAEPADPLAGDCFETIASFYVESENFLDVQFQADSASALPGVWDITGAMTMVVADGSGETLLNYVACSAIPDQNAIVGLEQLVPAASFGEYRAAMDELRAGFIPAP